MPAPPELACPCCLGGLDPTDQCRPIPSLACPRCDRVYSAEAGFLDFLGEPDHDHADEHSHGLQDPDHADRNRGLQGPGHADPSRLQGRGLRGLGPRLMHSPALARVYEKLWRPFFVAVASAGQANYPDELARVREWLRPAHGGALVDLSCGPGFTGRHLAISGDFSRVLGLDWSVAMLQRALASAGPDFPLLRADVARLPFAHASLAGAHAGAALHLWPDPDAAIAEVARVLRPGGVFVASTFVHRDALRPLTSTFQAIASARVFEQAELAGMCRAHGLLHFTPERRGALVMFSATRA